MPDKRICSIGIVFVILAIERSAIIDNRNDREGVNYLLRIGKIVIFENAAALNYYELQIVAFLT
jgi:hypothetical protein